MLLREQLVSKKFTLETVDDHQAKGVDDQIWVRKFAAAGGEAIVGGDSAMTKRPHELLAIKDTGLRLVALHPNWPRAKKHVQIAYLFFWWPHIEAVLSTSKEGDLFRVPWAWDDGQAITELTPNVDRARERAARQRDG